MARRRPGDTGNNIYSGMLMPDIGPGGASEYDSVADVLNRARTTHTPIQSGLGGGADHPSFTSAMSNNFPNTGVPGSVPGRSTNEMGGVMPNFGQQRMDLMSELDAMMNPFEQSQGEGVPSVPNYYGPQGQQQHSVYQPPEVDLPGAGPGYYGQTPMSGNDHWIPENPLSPSSTYGGLPGAGPSMYGGPNNSDGQVLDPLGVGAGPNNQFSPLNDAIGDVLDPIGQGAGPGYYQDPANREELVGDLGYSQDKPWASVPENDYDRMAAMDPESGWMKPNSRENISHNAIQSEKAESEMRERVAAEKVAEEWAARYGLDDDAKKREEEMIAEMQKIQKKQRIMYALAAFSGNQGLANMAGMVAEQDLAILDKKYGNATNQRMRDMQRSILFDQDGNYDPPESQEELYRALGSMGATPAEMDAIVGQFDYSKDEAKGQNWFNREQDRYEWTDNGKPPPGGGWVEAGDIKGSDIKTKGDAYANLTADEKKIARYMQEKLKLDNMDPNDPLYPYQVDLVEKLDSATGGASVSNMISMFNATKPVDGFGTFDPPDAFVDYMKGEGVSESDLTMDQYFRWWKENFYDKFMNNEVTANPTAGVQDVPEMTREEARKWLIKNNEDITEDEIEAELNRAGY